jgi:hypothetical protein
LRRARVRATVSFSSGRASPPSGRPNWCTKPTACIAMRMSTVSRRAPVRIVGRRRSPLERSAANRRIRSGLESELRSSGRREITIARAAGVARSRRQRMRDHPAVACGTVRHPANISVGVPRQLNRVEVCAQEIGALRSEPQRGTAAPTGRFDQQICRPDRGRISDQQSRPTFPPANQGHFVQAAFSTTLDRRSSMARVRRVRQRQRRRPRRPTA